MSRALAREIPGRDRPRASEPREDRLDRREQHVGDRDVDRRQARRAGRRRPARRARHRWPRRWRRVTSTATGSSSIAVTGAKPSRAAAIASTPEPQPDVEQAAALEAAQQVDAELRRGMRSGAERAARVDHHCGQVGRRRLPRWADPDPTRRHRAVEGAPRVLPPGGDGVAVAFGNTARIRLSPGRRVGDELQAACSLDLLEPLGMQVEHHAPACLGRLGADADHDTQQLVHQRSSAAGTATGRPSGGSARLGRRPPIGVVTRSAQRKALFSRRKKPSSLS